MRTVGFSLRAIGLASGAAAAVPCVSAAEIDRVGERPAIERHVDQADIDAGRIGLEELCRLGKALFEARFNALDGQGRPASTGDGQRRTAAQPAFIRTSGPDANSCMGCHFQPRSGGAGDFASNVFVLAQIQDPVVRTLDPGNSTNATRWG